ncbi:MAG: isoleucine--tRNA ligase [Cytophagia bacterium]|nr:MAG: isoleucine--tRNA ligase [Cytophagia bacterium]TAG39096.1 MAG: isoleucine--tRNA ligase [Cytophagia bacterium]
MKNYPEYRGYDHNEVEKNILALWESNKTFQQSINEREGKQSFVFYEGPPSANGMPGIHHVMARTIKDLFCRYKTLQGFQVERKAGWDTHGLPVELQVEKELSITKDDIGKKISVEEYNQKCRETVMKFTDIWKNLTEKMGYWVDMDNPYITYENQYIESVWYLLGELHKKNLLYKGYTIQPYSPKAGTGLSSHELNQPGCYKNVTDTTIVAQFKAIQNEKSAFLFELNKDNLPIYFLAWTTTPWTLPSNAALTLGGNIDYVIVQTFNIYTFLPQIVILAKDLMAKYFTEKGKEIVLEYKQGDKVLPYKILAEYKGKNLSNLDYEQLLPYVKPKKPAFRTILGDFVTTEDGTGIVHTAPTFGADDFRVSQQNNIPAILVKDENDTEVPLVDKQGRFVKEVTDFAGEYVKAEYEDDKITQNKEYKSVDVRIAIKLKTENKAFKVEKYEHPYPHCWRTDKPILYYPLDSWFIRTTAMKDKLVEKNKEINWQPESTGTGRFGNWLENLVDWNLSRQRYWGIPLPIWRSEDGKEEICIGSIEDLSKEIEKSIKAGIMTENPYQNTNFDLHRPYIDTIILVSPTGQKMLRETDLIDVWFDSGSMPYAQLGYPNKEGSKELLEKKFPADFISEGVDQTRGWFFTLHAIAVMIFDKPAFKNVLSTGLVLDKNGVKMSKRLGNIVDPFETMTNYGADATRWYIVNNSNPWDNLKFNLEGIAEVKRRFFGTLYNTYSFFALYANIDSFTLDEQNIIPIENRTELDRWIISVLQSLIKNVTESYDKYDATQATRLIDYFVNEQLSNWYVRLCRKRFWQGEMNADKKAAYETLYECLMVVGQLMSPVAPFFAERLYQDLTKPLKIAAKANKTPLQYDSVHLTYFTKAEENRIDKDLEEKMEYAQKISSLTHALRKKASMRVRLPLSRILIPVLDKKIQKQIEAVKEVIKSETNIKNIEFINDDAGILVKNVKPNFKTLSVKYKTQMKEVTALVNEMTSDEITLTEKNGFIQKNNFRIDLEDLLISSQEVQGFSVANDGNLTVALDTQLTSVLINEGIARDVVNRLQNLRKDSGLEVLDKINIKIVQKTLSSDIEKAINEFEEYIKTETQALQIEKVESIENITLFEIEQHSFEVAIKVVG